jgi:hypothetical protein
MKERWKTEKTLMKFCFKDTKKNQFRIELLLVMKNGFILGILEGISHGLIQIDSARRRCSVFGGIKKVWCIMSF